MLKGELRCQLRDRDNDGVPNGFDCHPYDPRRQEEFLPQDEKYLDNHPFVKMGKFLGKGCVGQVRELRNNPNLVVKTVRSYEGKEGMDVVESIRDGKFANKELKVEANFFTKNKLEKEPLFIPTRVVKIGPEKKLGLIHPKVHDRVEYYPHFHIEGKNGKKAFTPSKLKTLRQHIIELSYKGFVLVDGLQIGIDSAGRILQYDIGFMQRDKPGSDRPFEVNNVHWTEFINEFPGQIKRYGGITKNRVAKRPKK
jgi:hypothetical protein